MVKGFIGSFSDNLMEKSRNPFLGTYALVWLVRNWVIVYTLFNFDKELNMQDRIDIISCYFFNNPFWMNLFINIFLTLLLLALTYILLNASRLIMSFSEKKIAPLVSKITDEDSIVTIEKHNKVISHNEYLKIKIEDLKKQYFESENIIKELEHQLSEKVETIRLINETHIEDLYLDIKQNKFDEAFLDIYIDIQNDRFESNSYNESATLFLLSKKLLEYGKGDSDLSFEDWRLTPLAHKLFEYMKLSNNLFNHG